MDNKLTQLIPGNPGTSFVVALLYAIQQKYGENVLNDDQLILFTRGIIKSRNVFFSGVINEIALRFNKQIVFLTNSVFVLKLAKPEINKKVVDVVFSKLDKKAFDKLLNIYGYVVFSVDMFEFRKYHDYHFICISRKHDYYEVFEPKSGLVFKKSEKEIEALINSVTIGLKDILMCFVV
jgi:hypothetical protein